MSPERILVEAGAGCGKTTSIIEKFRLALQGKKEGGKAYLPEQCILLTFTDAAAKEMKLRIKNKYPELQTENAFIGTFHSYCLHLLVGAKLVDEQAKILSDDEMTTLVKDAFITRLADQAQLETLLSYVNIKEVLNLALWGNDNSKAIEEDFAKIEETWSNFAKTLRRSLDSLDLEDIDSLDWPHQALALLDKKLDAHIKFSQKKILKQIGEKNPKLLESVKMLRNLQDKDVLTSILGHFQKEKEIFSFLTQNLQEIRSALPSHMTFTEIERRCLQGLRDGRIKVNPLSFIVVDEFQDTSPEQWEIISKISVPTTDWYLVGDPKQSIYAFRKADIRLYKRLKKDIAVQQLATNYRSAANLLRITNEMQKTFFRDPLDPDPQELASGKEVEQVKHPAVLTEYEVWSNAILLERILQRNQELAGKSHAVLFREWKRLYEFSELLIKEKIPFEIQGSENYLEHFLTHSFMSYFWDAFQNKGATDFLNVFYEFCYENEPKRWPQGAEWASAMERMLTGFVQKDIKDWKKAAQILGSERLSSEKINPPKKDYSNTLQLKLLTIHGSKGLEFDFVYLPDPRERVTFKDQFEDDEIPFNYSIHGQLKSRSLYYELQKIERSFRLESEQKRLFYVAVTRAVHGLDFFIPKESSRPQNRDELPWWGIWREEKNIKRFKWSQVLRSLSEQDLPLRSVKHESSEERAHLLLKSLPRTAGRVPLKKTEKQEIFKSAHQLWGDSIHKVMQYWNGDAAELEKLQHDLGPELRAEVLQTAEELRKFPELQSYWDNLRKNKSDWKILREESLIQNSDDDEREDFYRADVIMLQKDRAIVLDWKSSGSEYALLDPERKLKIKTQLENYAKLLKPRIKNVKAIAIGIFRQGKAEKVKKILEIDL